MFAFLSQQFIRNRMQSFPSIAPSSTQDISIFILFQTSRLRLCSLCSFLCPVTNIRHWALRRVCLFVRMICFIHCLPTSATAFVCMGGVISFTIPRSLDCDGRPPEGGSKRLLEKVLWLAMLGERTKLVFTPWFRTDPV